MNNSLINRKQNGELNICLAEKPMAAHFLGSREFASHPGDTVFPSDAADLGCHRLFQRWGKLDLHLKGDPKWMKEEAVKRDALAEVEEKVGPPRTMALKGEV